MKEEKDKMTVDEEQSGSGGDDLEGLLEMRGAGGAVGAVEVLRGVGCIVVDNLAVQGCGAGLEGWGFLGVHRWDCEVRGDEGFWENAGKQRGFCFGVIGPMGG